MAAIDVRDLTCGPSLRGITFQVQAGEVAVLVGSRGSGKTTLLTVLAGLRPPDAGTVALAGVDAQTPAVRERVGVAGESWGLYPRLTVWENLRLHARLWGLDSHRVQAVAAQLELQPLARTLVQRLRPGEAARVRLARALLHDPTVILLDEPIGDVDLESASLLRFVIGEAAETGKAVLIATFGHPQTLALADRILYLEGGMLAEPGAAAEGRSVVGGGPVTGAGASEGGPAAGPTATPGGSSEGVAAAPLRHVAARRDDRVLLFTPAEIRYAYAESKSVYIATEDGPYLVSFTLAELEERLVEHGFFRSHRGYLVNLAWVKEIVSWTRDSHSLVLRDGREVPLSKHRARELRRRLGG